LLNTDGIRKSCATDGDFLELCSQMVAINDSDQLAAGLAEISAAGSGDDLSIAVASWSPSAQQASDRQDTLVVPEISSGTHGCRRVASILMRRMQRLLASLLA
jgi:hypothetical protein